MSLTMKSSGPVLLHSSPSLMVFDNSNRNTLFRRLVSIPKPLLGISCLLSDCPSFCRFMYGSEVVGWKVRRSQTVTPNWVDLRSVVPVGNYRRYFQQEDLASRPTFYHSSTHHLVVESIQISTKTLDPNNKKQFFLTR